MQRSRVYAMWFVLPGNLFYKRFCGFEQNDCVWAIVFRIIKTGWLVISAFNSKNKAEYGKKLNKQQT